MTGHISTTKYQNVWVPKKKPGELVLWRLIGAIQRLTGLDTDSIFKSSTVQKKSEPA